MRYVAMVMVLLAVLVVAAGAMGGQAYQFRDDLESEPLYDGVLQYYYYNPCDMVPYYSWFWAFGGPDDPWEHGTSVGAWFEVGDMSTGGFDVCDPTQCQTLDRLRVLDLWGVSGYPGYCRVKIDVFCCDEYGCPVGPSLWSSGVEWTWYGWNYFDIDPPLCITSCAVNPGPPVSRPRILVAITHDGQDYFGPLDNDNAWGADVISVPLDNGCTMYDQGGLPMLYPRPSTSYYTTMHSGYYGHDFEFCPPQWFEDPGDPTPDGSQYGFVELAWRIYLSCTGPTATQPATWGSIKSMYE